MHQKVNPFKPNSPVQPGMFVGRLAEVQRLETCLIQTRAGNPAHFMLVGERGIGKSSLLFFIKAIAEGYIDIDDAQVDFLVIDIDIDETTTSVALVKKIELGLRRGMAQTEKARDFLKGTWGFLQRIEASGFRLRPGEAKTDDETIIDEFAYSLADAAKRICNKDYFDQEIFSSQKDGILILIDEADNASKTLRLGSFLKLLLERLQRRGCDKIMVGLAGLPELRNVLATSHPSSIRLFDDLELNRLNSDEVRRVINRGLKEAAKQNAQATTIVSEAEDRLVSLSEGFPHFIQQFSYSAFAADTNDIIDDEDVLAGAVGKNGAIALIGNRYYREDYYRKIKEESYRQVLGIMADYWDDWVTKRDIRKKFKGKNSTLDNAIRALRDRKIIVSKEGERGVYRLQNKGFAFWIKLYTKPQPELGLEIPSNEQE